MRVVVVTSSYPLNEDDASGHFVRASSAALAKGGVDVHVVAPGGSVFDPPAPTSIGSGTVVVHRAGGGALFTWPGAIARLRASPARLLAAGSFAAGVRLRLARIGAVDRAVAHWIVPCAWPLMLGTAAPLEVVAHGACVRLLVSAPRPLREHVVATLLARGARFTFAAHALRDTLAAAVAGPLADRLARASRVEPPTLDVTVERGAPEQRRRTLGLGPGEALAVTAGRLVGSKRVDLAIEALRAASTRLVVLGDGPERARLEGAASAAGVRALFTGTVSRREALAWIAAADFLLHTSALEAAPSVVREARALGTPVVACPSGDIELWAAADPGILLVEPRARSIARAVAAMGRRAPSPPS
jgi:teichuronic acid biosynthesis glycosyltransferase TuaC